MTKLEIQNLFNEWVIKLRENNYPIGKNINKNLNWLNSYNSYGMCYYKDNEYHISISKYMTEKSKKAVENTIIHELLHTINDCMDHGRLWKYYSRKIYNEFGYNIKRCGGDKSKEDKNILLKIRMSKIKNKPKYVVKCPCCGRQWTFIRISKCVKNPENFDCLKCKHPLESVNYRPESLSRLVANY